MGQRTYLDIFPSGTTRERGKPLTPRARPPLLGQPEPPAKLAGFPSEVFIGNGEPDSGTGIDGTSWVA